MDKMPASITSLMNVLSRWYSTAVTALNNPLSIEINGTSKKTAIKSTITHMPECQAYSCRMPNAPMHTINHTPT